MKTMTTTSNVETFRVPRESILSGMITGLKFAALMLFLCGLVYSLMVTLAGGALFPDKASGSLIMLNAEVVGSELIGQPFQGAGYFHGRPSAAGYDPTATAGSNLAPDNPQLRERAVEDSRRIQQLEGVTAEAIPVEMLTASGSGLDPHITLRSVLLQIPRIAKARNLDETVLVNLAKEHEEPPQFGMLGQYRINVLKLNLALDHLMPERGGDAR